MNIEYDEETDAAFVWLVKDIDSAKKECTGEIWPLELNGNIGLLFNEDNKIMGIEVLQASFYLSKDILVE